MQFLGVFYFWSICNHSAAKSPWHTPLCKEILILTLHSPIIHVIWYNHIIRQTICFQNFIANNSCNIFAYLHYVILYKRLFLKSKSYIYFIFYKTSKLCIVNVYYIAYIYTVNTIAVNLLLTHHIELLLFYYYFAQLDHNGAKKNNLISNPIS